MLTPMRSAFRLGDLEPRVAQGLDPSGHAVMDEGIHAAGFLGREVGGDVEALDLAGDAP
jgi:hypothetical protein